MDGRAFLLAAAISAALPLAAALRITEICPRPEEADPNGRESGWVELFNDGDAAVDLGEYELQRFNLGKKASAGKFSNLPAASLAPGEYFIVYTSEEYDNAEGLADEFSFSLDSSVVTARGSVCVDVVVRQDTGIDVSGLPAPSDMGVARRFRGRDGVRPRVRGACACAGRIRRQRTHRPPRRVPCRNASIPPPTLLHPPAVACFLWNCHTRFGQSGSTV